jgi:hypothetical protein
MRLRPIFTTGGLLPCGCILSSSRADRIAHGPDSFWPWNLGQKQTKLLFKRPETTPFAIYKTRAQPPAAHRPKPIPTIDYRRLSIPAPGRVFYQSDVIFLRNQAR